MESRDNSVRWILEGDKTNNDDISIHIQATSSTTNNPSSKTSMKHGNRPKTMSRTQSGAERGFRSIRFLDMTASKEGEGWKKIEKQFHLFAVQDRLSKDMFGTCIGKPKTSSFLSTLLISIIYNSLIYIYTPKRNERQ